MSSRTYTPPGTSAPQDKNNVIDLYALRQDRLRAGRERGRQAQNEPQTFPISREEAARLDALADGEEFRARVISKCPPCHWGLLLSTLLLSILSVPLVYSASMPIALNHHSHADFFLWRQIMFVGIGLVGMLAFSRLPAPTVRRLLWAAYFATLIGLILIDFTPLGLSMGGVRRWMKFGPMPLQISEFAKLALVGALADFWSRAAQTKSGARWPWAAALTCAGIPALLIFMEPHLSAASLLMALPFCIGFYAGAPLSQMGKILTPFVLAAIIGIGLCKTHQMPFLKAYQQDRIAAHFGSKGADEQGANYQKLQGERALSRGGLLGAGPGQSFFKQGLLPAPHTDFILAVTGEEWGLVGMLALLTLYGAMIFFCFHTGHYANTAFEALLCVGVGTLLALQLAGNGFVATGMGPVTGMPLPLISYGGSGLISTLCGLGLVLGVSRQYGQEQTSSRQNVAEDNAAMQPDKRVAGAAR